MYVNEFVSECVGVQVRISMNHGVVSTSLFIYVYLFYLNICSCLCAFLFVCVYVCVCERERERENERVTGGTSETPTMIGSERYHDL